MTDGGDDATKTINPSSGGLLAEATPDAPGEERPLARGTEVGRYVVLSVVGGGGMGFVYSAFDPELDRRVALKLLRKSSAGPEAHARLLREAQAMARLNHPNVVTVYDAGLHEGRVFLAMEYVAGVTLREWLDQKPRGWREKLYVLAEAGRGLAAAHAAHLVHRDVKPANIIVGEDGRVRVTDFGIARSEAETTAVTAPGKPRIANSDSFTNLERARDKSWSEALTREGAVVGTMGYLSPEQAESKPSDARTDQFSFCVTAWEVLYGARPFPRDSVETYIEALLKGQLVPPPASTDVPRRVLAVLKKGLAVTPDARFPKMEGLLDELLKDPGQRARALAPWALLGLLVVGLVAGLSINEARKQRACAGFEAGLAGAWDEGTRAKLRAAYASVTAPWATDVEKGVERALDAWTQAWLAQKQASCEATVVEDKQTEAQRALRDGCLDRRLGELTALTGALQELEAASADKALSAVYALRSPTECADLSRLRATPGAKEASAVREAVDKGFARLELGQLDKALPLLEQAVKDAEAQQLSALSAEAWLGLAMVQQHKGAFDDSHASNLKALRAAFAAGLDELVARAAVRLAVLEGFHQGKGKASADWLPVVQGAIDRLGGDARLSMEQLQAEGVLAYTQGDAATAAQKHDAALQLGKSALGEEHPALWKTYLELGSVLISAHEYRKAVAMLEEALKRRAAVVGTSHPEVALVLANLGTARFYAGDAEGSAQAFREALNVREAILGKDSPRLVPLLGNMGDIELRSGRLDEARAHLDRAGGLAEKAFGPKHTYTLAVRLNRAWVALTEADLASARAAVDAVLAAEPMAPVKAEAFALRSRLDLSQGKAKEALADALEGVKVAESVGPESGELLLPLLAQGAALLDQGKAKDAVAPLTRALAVADKTQSWPVHRAQVQVALGRALAMHDAARAKALLEDAVKTLTAAPGQQAEAERAQAALRAVAPAP